MPDFLYKNNPDQNLKQGQLILERQSVLLNRGQKRMDLLEQTSSANLGSGIEAYTNANPDPTTDKQKVQLRSITALETEFNQTLVQYTANYKMLMTELISNKPDLQKYYGKNVKYNNNIYHVNKHGFTHLYDDTAWTGKSDSCKSEPIDIAAEEFSQLLKGPNMGVGQACDVAGYNITNQSTSDRAWVDIKGVKHLYPKDVWTNRSESCKAILPKSIKGSEFTSLPTNPSSPPLTEQSMCNRLNVDPIILQNLAMLNDKLLKLGQELLRDTMNLGVTDNRLKAQINKLNLDLTKQINNLKEDRHEFVNTTHNFNNVRMTGDEFTTNIAGIKQSTGFKLSSNYLQYLIWVSIAIFLVIFTFFSYTSDRQSNISLAITGILLLLVLYTVLMYLYGKVF
jgi:hypothetical protein